MPQSNYFEKLKKNPSVQQKMAVRNYILEQFHENKVIYGLPGPDINGYTKWCKDNGFEELFLYEKDVNIIEHQRKTAKHDVPFSLKLGDINEEVFEKKGLQDLDYCCTVNSIKHVINKFQGDFIMTFSRRRLGNKSIDIFFELRKETINFVKNFTSPIKHSLYITDKGEYIYAPYFDTSAMMIVAKIK